jgi:membrane protein involved in colicin uptake
MFQVLKFWVASYTMETRSAKRAAEEEARLAAKSTMMTRSAKRAAEEEEARLAAEEGAVPAAGKRVKKHAAEEGTIPAAAEEAATTDDDDGDSDDDNDVDDPHLLLEGSSDSDGGDRGSVSENTYPEDWEQSDVNSSANSNNSRWRAA